METGDKEENTPKKRKKRPKKKENKDEKKVRRSVRASVIGLLHLRRRKSRRSWRCVGAVV